MTATRPPGRQPDGTDPYLPRHGHADLHVTRYELDLDYRVASNRLSAHARVHATATRAASRFTLDLVGLRVSRVVVNGRRATRWSHRAGALSIVPEQPLAVGSSVVVEIEYGGHPRPTAGPWGEVGWEELADGVIVAGQPDGAPSWFPCNDDPGDKASFQIAITTESPYHVVANGALVSRSTRASRTRWVYEQTEPMSPYLATVQIGRYTTLTTGTGRVPQVAALPARLEAAFRHDFARQSAMMDVFEDLFGPYPFARYDVVVTDDDLEIPLEAQGMSVFGANHVDGRRGSERLIAHELAHQWFGNSVTAAHWRHIWLHEGFACYAEWLWSERSGGPTADEIATRSWSLLAGLPQDIVIGDPGPELMFDDRVYQRGALTLHALRRTIGDDVFVESLHAWTGTYRHGSATTAQFIDCAERRARRDLGPLFDAWLMRGPLPSLP